MTWSELVTQIQQRYPATRVAASNQLALTVQLARHRNQLVVVDQFAALGDDWVAFRTRICAVDRLAPAEALLRSSQLVVGGICRDGDFYVLRHHHRLASLHAGDLAFAIEVLAQTADDLEASLEIGSDRF